MGPWAIGGVSPRRTGSKLVNTSSTMLFPPFQDIPPISITISTRKDSREESKRKKGKR
jgi:hypothetical protein